MKPNKITTEMDAHLEAHPPTIEWTEGAGGIKHGTVIEEIPLPKKAPDLSVDDLIASGSLDTPELPYMETLDEFERGGH